MHNRWRGGCAVHARVLRVRMCVFATSMQHIATHCNTLQHTATHYGGCAVHARVLRVRMCVLATSLQHIATHCNTLLHSATHCNKELWRRACVSSPHVQHNAVPGNTLQHTATHYNTLQHTATNCNKQFWWCACVFSTKRNIHHCSCVAACVAVCCNMDALHVCVCMCVCACVLSIHLPAPRFPPTPPFCGPTPWTIPFWHYCAVSKTRYICIYIYM